MTKANWVEIVFSKDHHSISINDKEADPDTLFTVLSEAKRDYEKRRYNFFNQPSGVYTYINASTGNAVCIDLADVELIRKVCR